ncbi:MAG: hypothetical protein ABIK15_19010 [Pseudomonadota bacterium]
MTPAAFIEPKAARLIGKVNEEIRVDIKITPPQANIFDITGISVADGTNMRFQLEKRDASASRYFVLHVFNTKPDAGRYVDRITLATTSPTSPELTVRVFGIIRD